jgi:transglutaminase-like putative cysteine protease
MLISVRHVTRYHYAEPATYSAQSLRLTPVPFAGQRVLQWNIGMPGIEAALSYRDCFGNIAHLVTSQLPHRELVIEASGVVETQDCSGLLQGLAELTPARVYLRQTRQTRAQDGIRALASTVSDSSGLDRLHALCARVRERIDYVVGTTDAHTSAEDVLADAKGVCQDHAHVFISAARALAVPARYVTGYLLTDAKAEEVAHHAWAEAWVDGLGWVGFDVANGICPTDRYVRLACGFDAGYAAPVRGTRRGGGSETLKVLVAVQQAAAQQ